MILQRSLKLWRSINRNIVECKVRYLDRERVCADRINRNIVECKAIPLCHRQIPGIVLIETSWNVKLWNFFAGFVLRIVLIETSWNVKEERPVLRQSLLHSINRNIVECKGRWDYEFNGYLEVLIETSWNVKNFLFVDRSIVRMVLIETSWNVKNRMRITADKITPVLIETSWNVKKAAT